MSIDAFAETPAEYAIVTVGAGALEGAGATTGTCACGGAGPGGGGGGTRRELRRDELVLELPETAGPVWLAGKGGGLTGSRSITPPERDCAANADADAPKGTGTKGLAPPMLRLLRVLSSPAARDGGLSSSVSSGASSDVGRRGAARRGVGRTGGGMVGLPPTLRLGGRTGGPRVVSQGDACAELMGDGAAEGGSEAEA